MIFFMTSENKKYDNLLIKIYTKNDLLSEKFLLCRILGDSKITCLKIYRAIAAS